MSLLPRILMTALVFWGFICESKLAPAADKAVGIVWQLGFKTKSDKINWGGNFRATPDMKVWNNPKTSVPRVVGSWSGTEENTKMSLDGLTHPKNVKVNGEYEFVLVGMNPKTWQGTFTQAKTGKKVPVFIRLVKD